jgi:hypothetical protein
MMDVTPPPTTDRPDGDTAPLIEPERPRRDGRVVAALILIALGLVFLAGNLLPIGGGLLFLGLGAAFALARFLTGNYGFAVPAGILLGFGAFVAQEEAGLLPGDGGGWFFVMLGLGFLAVYLLGLRPRAIWPLFPAAVLLAFGAALLGLLPTASLAVLAWLGLLWPVILIAAGLWLLLRDRLPTAVRTPLAALVLVLLVALAAVAAAGSAVGAAPAWRPMPIFGWLPGGAPLSETVSLVEPLPAGGVLRVDNPNGRTVVRAGSSDEVRVTATVRFFPGASRPEAVLQRVGNDVVLETRLPGTGFQRGAIDYEIEAPAGARVEVSSASGDIAISGIAGPVQVTSASGDLRLTDLAGPVTARSVSGELRLEAIAGELHANSTSGDIEGTDLRHPREITTISGDIELAAVFADAATISSTSGDVTLRFDPASAVTLDVTTVSGDIQPRLPGLTIASQERRGLSGTLGTGQARLEVRTVSGDVTLTDAT